MSSLSDPLDLPSGVRLPNRIAKAALSEALGDADNSPDERIVTLYRRWAQGGYGLLITGNIMVDRAHLGEPGNVVIEDDRALPELTRVDQGRARRRSGDLRPAQPPRASVQPPEHRAHAGRTQRRRRWRFPARPRPRELTSVEIEDIIDRFATAAAVCEDAGFDGVQIHAAHGYLVTQFLSPLTNLRDDEWGGDPTRRMRFLIEVVRRVRTRVSPGFAVSVKLNSADFQRGGFSEDDSRAVVAALAQEAVDLIEVSGGNYESPAMSGSAAVLHPGA